MKEDCVLVGIYYFGLASCFCFFFRKVVFELFVWALLACLNELTWSLIFDSFSNVYIWGGALVVLVIATISFPQYCLQFLCRFTWGFTEVPIHNKMRKFNQQCLKTLLRYDSEILCSEKIVLFRKEEIIVSCRKHIKGKNYFPMNFSFIVNLCCLLHWRGLENRTLLLQLIIAESRSWSLFLYPDYSLKNCLACQCHVYQKNTNN